MKKKHPCCTSLCFRPEVFYYTQVFQWEITSFSKTIPGLREAIMIKCLAQGQQVWRLTGPGFEPTLCIMVLESATRDRSASKPQLSVTFRFCFRCEDSLLTWEPLENVNSMFFFLMACCSSLSINLEAALVGQTLRPLWAFWYKSPAAAIVP